MKNIQTKELQLLTEGKNNKLNESCKIYSKKIIFKEFERKCSKNNEVTRMRSFNMTK